MPYPTDESDTNTLPDPELNPLLNPLLAAHMGRWAEVYFTNPPEKREQAVAELIRELKNTSPVESGSVEATDDQRAWHETSREPLTSFPEEPLRTCSACAYKNSPEQNFCGMCGTPLQVSPRPNIQQVAEAVPAGLHWKESEPPLERESGHDAAEPTVSFPTAVGTAEEQNSNEHDSTWSLPENELPHFAMEREPVPYRYRVYVGAVLAILLVTLVYMAWRGTKAISGTAGPQSVPSKVIPPAPAAAAQQPRTTPSSSSASNPTAAAVPGKRQPETPRRKNEIADAQPASRIVTKAAGSAPIVQEQSGAEDLATAEKYLNSAPGVARDSGQAAVWLWKAVGKGNATATMALSDLYLRGDGVPKSCDQARLLLDAAARKGSRTAGERLRNLRAFGCE
ncbi:MAG TPA: hypothetical protein VNX26_07295 [Candidatus Acidoferrum sp.]|nr:hypothetical protein [Candidatus Acidoferrum sp.]